MIRLWAGENILSGQVMKKRCCTDLPNTEESDEKVVRETSREHLGDHEYIRREGRLEHDGHVGCVEESDGVGTALASEAVRLDWDLDAETLEVNDDSEHEDGDDEVHDVGESVTEERLSEGAALVVPGEEEVEEGDDGAFELGTTTCVDCCWGKGFPDDGLADVGGNKEGDA